MKLLPEVLKRIFTKPATFKYPEKKPEVPERLRGMTEWTKEKCIFCMLCQMNCPPQAISINKDKKEWSVDVGKCIFCGRCEDICPKNAIKLTKNYELADKSRYKLKFQFR
jgi:formate hydrogenlyase subunit 6/NADH:ubiquinone oxidoreductase subunit I